VQKVVVVDQLVCTLKIQCSVPHENHRRRREISLYVLVNFEMTRSGLMRNHLDLGREKTFDLRWSGWLIQTIRSFHLVRHRKVLDARIVQTNHLCVFFEFDL